MKLKKLKMEYVSELRERYGGDKFYNGVFADAKIYLTKKLIQEIIAGCTRVEFSNLKEAVNETEMSLADTIGAELVIAHLNRLVVPTFKTTSGGLPTKSATLINARIKDGAKIEDLLAVIDVKAAQWLGTDYEKYLRPSTLFRKSKFANYINEVVR